MKNYETPFIQVINFEEEVHLDSSGCIPYPWSRDEDFEYFE